VTSRWAILAIFAAGVLTVPVADSGCARAADDLPFATDMRIAGDNSQTRFVMDVSRKIELRAFTLADPYRVVVDIPQVAFQVPPRLGEKGRGLIKAFRFGLVMAGGSRIVLDVARPVKVEKAFVLDAARGQPARLVLDLAAIDRDTFMRNLSLEDRGRPPALLASVPPASAATGDPRPIVVIDPGHGGIDTGTKSAAGDEEKSVVLDIGLMLRDAIERTGKYRVVMTRTDDTFVPLADRVRFARERQGALFLSIHADALPRREGDAQGATVYTLSERASDAEAARLAETENKADVIAGLDLANETGDVADILVDLAQRETKNFSHQFARRLVGELKGAVRLHQSPMKSAGFRVLKAPDVPSVLLELGYMSNHDDLKLLKSEAWRAKTVDTIARAIDLFFSTRKLAGAGAAQP
jgi:N-acetylmuramoyl-L-alanine amidase